MKKLCFLFCVLFLVILLGTFTKKANAYSYNQVEGNYKYVYWGSYDNKYQSYFTQFNTSAAYSINAYPLILIKPKNDITFSSVRIKINCGITTATNTQVSLSIYDSSCVNTGIQSATTTIPCYGANPYVYDYLFPDIYFYFNQDINFANNSTSTIKINAIGDKTKITRQFGNTAGMSGNQRIGYDSCMYSSLFSELDLYDFSIITESPATSTPAACPFITRISRTLMDPPWWINLIVVGAFCLLFTFAYYGTTTSI